MTILKHLRYIDLDPKNRGVIRYTRLLSITCPLLYTRHIYKRTQRWNGGVSAPLRPGDICINVECLFWYFPLISFIMSRIKRFSSLSVSFYSLFRIASQSSAGKKLTSSVFASLDLFCVPSLLFLYSFLNTEWNDLRTIIFVEDIWNFSL